LLFVLASSFCFSFKEKKKKKKKKKGGEIELEGERIEREKGSQAKFKTAATAASSSAKEKGTRGSWQDPRHQQTDAALRLQKGRTDGRDHVVCGISKHATSSRLCLHSRISGLFHSFSRMNVEFDQPVTRPPDPNPTFEIVKL
jgi:hypothetical protein